MKIVFGVFLIAVASTFNHHDTHSWKRKEDCKITAASRSIVPIKIKETRLQRSDIHRSRLSNSREDNILQNSPRRFAIAEDSDEHYDFWKPEAARTRQDLTRENRAIESTLKNVIGKPSKVEQYQYLSNFPYGGDESADAILENAEHPKSSVFSKDTQDHFVNHNAEEMDWSGQEVIEKDSKDEDEKETDIQELLNEMRRKRLNVLEEMVDGHRQGRGRKLTSQQQGALLVETLRKKRNYTNDHRGHSSNLQNGLMDMLGRSM